ncbi:MAG: histidine ammonia-lyase [Acidobacteriota bacterium]
MMNEAGHPSVPLDGRTLTLEGLEAVARGATVSLSRQALDEVDGSEVFVRKAVDEGRVAYGITTGFGHFATVTIPRDRVEDLQKNLIRSHAVGVGEPLPDDVVRAIMALRINCLLRGRSGVRAETLQALAAMLNADIVPLVPCQGSVGASGDLAPLAHVALALMGEGTVRGGCGTGPAAEVLGRAGLAPVVLQAKEGLALINGTQGMTALLALAASLARRLVKEADVAGALSLETLRGTRRAFDPRVHAERPHPGQVASARNLWRLLEDSPVSRSHSECGKVQDAYSLRCMPQVHGAVRDAVGYVERVLAVEMNAATDNPMIFAGDGEILSGGNFHGAPAALAADLLSAALTDLASISERRCARLVDGRFSGLPDFLVREGGLNSGFMMVQVTAAALVSECKTLSHPASVDSIPTSAGQEDHVSMGFWAARKALLVARNAAKVLAAEVRSATQGMGFLAPLEPAQPLRPVLASLRAAFPAVERDRYIQPELESLAGWIEEGRLCELAARGGVVLE